MEYNAFITSVGVGTFFAIASHRFLCLHRRTRMWPELWLGLYFGFTGLFYLQLELPGIAGLESWPAALGIAFEWVYVFGVFAYLLFIRSAFRPASLWANAAVGFCSAVLFFSTALGAREGPLEFSLENPFFLAQWIGYTIPCAWIWCEALQLRRGAKRRARIGLCPPVVANRYLLLIWFGSFQLLACLADLSWANDIGSNQTVSTASDLLLGFAEIASAGTLWLAFFPPRFYTDWVTRTAVILPTPMGD